MAIKATPVPTTLPKVYPHVDEIPDWQTQQTARLLWDRIHNLEARLQANESTTTQLVSGHNQNEASIATNAQSITETLALVQSVGASQPGTSGAGSGGTPSPGPQPGNFPQPFDAVKNPNPQLGRTASYVQQMIHQAFLTFEANNPHRQPEANEQYWYQQFLTKNTLDPNGSGDGWGAYWWDRIQSSPSVPL